MDVFSLIGKISIEYANADKALTEISSKSDHAANSLKKMDSFSESLSKGLNKLGDVCGKVGKALAPLSAAAAAALTLSVKGASDFTDSMAKMSTLFDTTKVSVGDLSKEFIDLSNKTGISAKELAEAGYQAMSAGQDVKQVGSFVETAGNLARAGFTSTTTAVDVLTTAINAYGESAGSAEEIANKLVRTQNLGKTTVDELASSMGKIIPTASAMNVDINNLTSGYVALTKQGIATAEATTYMNAMLNELGDSGTNVGKILKDKTGKSFQELMDSGYSLADVLKALQDEAKESGTNFNELWSSSEAGKSALAMLNGGVDEFNETVETMKSETDDVSIALEKLETPSVKVHKAFNQIKNSGIELGTTIISAMIPAIERVTNIISKATEWFNTLDENTKVTIGTFLALVTALAPVLLIGEKVFQTLGSLVSVIGAIPNPILIVVGAIAAFVAAIVYLYNTNEDFRIKVQVVWESIKEKISGVINALNGVISAFVGLSTYLWNIFGDDIMRIVSVAFDYISGFISGALDIIKAVIETATAIIKGDWEGAWEGIKNIFSTVWDAIKTNVSNAMNIVKNVISIGIDAAKGVIDSVLGAIGDKFTSIFEGAKTTVQNAIEYIKGMFNFSWSLPHISLPHFSVSGGEAPWGFMGKGSLPSVSVSWYKKAMQGMIMDVPTIFGMDNNGNLMAGGEAGSETVVGTDNLMAMIEHASNKGTDKIIELLARICYLLSPDNQKENIREAFKGLGYEVDGREFARLVRKYA